MAIDSAKCVLTNGLRSNALIVDRPGATPRGNPSFLTARASVTRRNGAVYRIKTCNPMITKVFSAARQTGADAAWFGLDPRSAGTMGRPTRNRRSRQTRWAVEDGLESALGTAGQLAHHQALVLQRPVLLGQPFAFARIEIGTDRRGQSAHSIDPDNLSLRVLRKADQGRSAGHSLHCRRPIGAGCCRA